MPKCQKFICAAALIASTMPAWSQTQMYVGGFGGSIEKIFKEKIIPAFEQKTNSRITYVTGNSTDTLAKLRAQKGSQELSLAMIDDGPMYQAVGAGLCAPIKKTGSINELYKNAEMVGGKSIGFNFIATGLAYNKDVFKKNGWAAPTSWKDLADPKFKGKVVIPPITNGYGLLTLVMMSRIEGGSEERMDPGFASIKDKVAPNVLAWEPSPGKMAQMMQTGEAALVVWGNVRVQAVAEQGAPVEFVYPKEGAVTLMSAACVVEGAPQPALAQQFLEYIVSADVQALLATTQSFGPVNKNTKLPNDVAAKVVFGPDKVNNMVAVNYDVINAKRAEWTNRWNREVEK